MLLNYGLMGKCHTVPGRDKITLLVLNKLFQEHQINTITADAMAPSIPRPPAAMATNVHEKQVIAFLKKGFPLTSVPSLCEK